MESQHSQNYKHIEIHAFFFAKFFDDQNPNQASF